MVHPALVRYTKRSRTEALFVRWQKTVCPRTGRSRSEADRTGADRNQISPKWPGIPTGSPLDSGNQERKTGQKETAEVERRKPGRRREKGKVPASVPVPERNRNRLSPQLRCQTRFRCELAKQTQSKLGIVHPALVRYTKRSRTEALFVRWQKTVCPRTGRSRSEADRTGADRNQISPKWPGIPKIVRASA